MATEYKLSYTASEIDEKLGKIDDLATKNEVPTKTSELTNDSGYLTSYTETDPTVPAWAKANTKPSYTKSEVGLGNVDNVKQYSVNNPPPYPVTSVNGKSGSVQIDIPTIPSTLPNPNTLTINGKSYDGSASVDMTDIINVLIDDKLGVIVNGAY